MSRAMATTTTASGYAAGGVGDMHLSELHASLNRSKAGFDRWAHNKLNAIEGLRQRHEAEVKKASVEIEELKQREKR